MFKNKGNLKVIHVVSSLNVGGAERFVIDMSECQKSSLSKVAILSFGTPDEKLVEVAQAKGIETYTVSNASTLLGQLQILWILLHFDLIHIHTSYALKTLGLVIKFIGKKSCIYTRHGAAPINSSAWQKVHNRFRPYIKGMTFVSQEAKDIYRNTYCWNDISMQVVDNGVVLPQAGNKYLSENTQLRIGSVGRLVPLKHQISLLRAIAKLPEADQKNIAVHIYGDGECEHELRSYAQDKLQKSSIEFHGMITDREEIYNSFDVLVVTSETEGLSLAIMEAMAYGKPVIATDVGGNGYLLNKQQNGWLFNYDDATKLSQLISALIAEPELLMVFGQRARSYIAEHYSISNTAKKYEKIYRS